MLREILLSHATGSQTNLLASANPALLAGQGTVTVTIASTRLNDLGEAVSQLLHYPYGCAEQTGSSLLPWIVLRDTPELARAAAARHQRHAGRHSRGRCSPPLDADPIGRAGLLAAGKGTDALGQRLRGHGARVGSAPRSRGAQRGVWGTAELPAAAVAGHACGGADLADCCLGLYALALAGRSEPAYHEKFYSLREKLAPEQRALLALAISESQGPSQMIGELLNPRSSSQRRSEALFGSPAREEAVRLLAWIHYRPDDQLVDRLVDDLMREQREAHWGTTQGDAWALLALTEYAKRVEANIQPAQGQLKWGGQSVDFRLQDRTNIFTHTLALTNLAGSSLTLNNATSNRLYTRVVIEARPPETHQPKQDHGFGLQRDYKRLDDDNRPQDLHGLRVGDRVLVTLKLSVHEAARYVAVDDALPAVLEAVNPEFKTQTAGPRRLFGLQRQSMDKQLPRDSQRTLLVFCRLVGAWRLHDTLRRKGARCRHGDCPAGKGGGNVPP